MRMAMSDLLRRTKSTLSAAVKGVKSIETKISKRTIAVSLSAFIITAVTVGAMAFDVSYALAVNYKGETLGYISSREVYSKAIDNIKERSDDATRESIKSVEIKEQVASVGSVLNAEDLENAIIDNVESSEELFGLYINKELYAVADSKDAINKAKHYYIEAKQADLENAHFVDSLEIVSGYYDKESVLSAQELIQKFESDDIKVGGYKLVTRTEKIEYEIDKTKSDKYPKGEKIVTRKGSSGEQKIQAKVFYENGKAVREEIISKDITKKPVAKKVTVGIGEVFTIDFPLKDSYSLVSDYGEWRGGYAHQGMDIASSYGVPIYASASGTVIEASYSNYGWGLNVLIDHGNGIKTRYAHCSSLDVTVGEKVARGEKIAEIGMTGDASCNHVHFEVYNGGVRVNPHDYLIN